MSQSAIKVGELDLTQSIITSKFQPDRLIKVPSGVVFLDTKSRQLGIWQADSVEIKSSYGSSESDLFEPVDITVNQLDVFILEQSTSKIARFDASLNFIQDIVIGNQRIYPSHMALDSRRNIFILSPETDEIFYSKNYSSNFNLFLDLSAELNEISCIKDMAINTKNELAVLMLCKDWVGIYSESGRIISRHRIKIDEPFLILYSMQNWLTLNAKGSIQILGKEPIQLVTDGQQVKDAIIENKMLWIMSEKAIVIYDLASLL